MVYKEVHGKVEIVQKVYKDNKVILNEIKYLLLAKYS